MHEEPRDTLLTRFGDTTPRDRRNQKRVLWLLVTWAILFTGASQLIKRGMLPDGPIPWVLAVLPSIAMLAVLVLFARFLHQADELQRTLQLNALALGFGVGLLALTGYSVFERLEGVPALGADDFMLVILTAYTVGYLWGWRRYR